MALILGWICSVIFNPVNLLVLAFLTSFLAGSVLLNVFREELAKSTLTSYPWFLAGVSVITLSLLSYAVLMAKA